MQNFIGQQIDRYRVTERLGMGGMAVVYKAYDTRLERDVAIKVIRTEAIPPEQVERLMQRFEREAKAQAQFSHPNIVPVYDYGEVNGSPFLVMEYISGGTLKEKLGKPVPCVQAIAWVAPIADALSYAHSLGVVHRDVKPSNILFNRAGRPILTDFGIAKILEGNDVTLTGTGLGVGTPEYMAPEQWHGQASEANDQYALGVVLYELITGQKPYTAETPVAIALKQMSEPLQRPSKLVADIPESLEKVLYKALAMRPEDRYESMRHFYSALISLVQRSDTEPISSRMAAEVDLVGSEAETVDQLSETPHYSLSVPPATPKPASKKAPRRSFPGWVVGVGVPLLLLCLAGAVVAAVLVSRNLGREDREEEPVPISAAAEATVVFPTQVIETEETGASTPILQPTNPKATATAFVEKPTPEPTSSVYITPTPRLYTPLSDCAESQLHLGDSAFVSYDGGKNRLRSAPDTSKDNSVGEIQPGEVVMIIDGPVCNFGWVLWKVETTAQKSGWTPEGDGTEFWLLPLTTRQVCDGALPTRLVEGKKAKVNEEPPDANLLREGPSRFDTVIDRIKPGHWMKVLEGPVCGEKANWWKVESLDTGKVGWTMEGNLDTYYLSPEP